MIGLRHILDTLRIPNPDQDLDLYRRALQAPFSTLHDTSIRIPDRDSRLRLSGLPLISSLSSDWVQAADNDHDRFDSDFFSLSRISLLGNAVLSFLIGSHLVVALPAAAEGVLTRMRAAILCQSYLAPVAVSLDLGSAYLRPVAAEDPSPKTLTELLSALFGVLYRCQGIEACRRVLARVLFRHDPDAADLRQYWDGVHPQSMIDQIIADCQSFRWDGLESIQMLTGGPWQHPELITAALTHQSSGGQHQQRLEYLGDAVLQLLVTDQLLDLFPDATEGELSQLRTSLVQNDTLVDVAKHLHLSEWIAHGISRPDRKIFADAVEALLGALYLDRHLGVCRQLISDVILTTKSIASARNRSNAKSQLQQLLSAKSGQNPNYIQVPKTTTPSSKSASSNWVEVQIYHQQNVLATGRGRSLKQAESNAAQNALHLMDTNAVVVPSNSRARFSKKT